MIKNAADPEFSRLLGICHELSGRYPEGVIYIGGIAVYVHAINDVSAATYAETTHDADLYISLADMADLRDDEDVTTNRRLSKHQMILGGFDFDVYTERHSALIVPFGAVSARRVTYGTVNVACLEHLFALKLEAYAARHASAKGDKDAADLYRLSMMASTHDQFDHHELAPYLTDRHMALLNTLERGATPVMMAQGNVKTAKHLRRQFADFVAAQRRLSDASTWAQPSVGPGL